MVDFGRYHRVNSARMYAGPGSARWPPRRCGTAGEVTCFRRVGVSVGGLGSDGEIMDRFVSGSDGGGLAVWRG